MYKVIFADDERLVRERISKIINWNEAGFQLVASCANGHEVLEAIDSDIPDLVVLDINMPFINGMDAARQIKSSYPHAKIVFLTGYSEFEYAKRAIDLGAFRYIVKPVSADDIRTMLAEAKEVLDQEERNMQKVATLEQLYAENQKVLLRDLIKQTDEDIYSRVKAQGFDWTKDTLFQVAVLNVNDTHENSSWQTDDTAQMLYAIANIAAELAGQTNLGYAYMKDETVVFIGYGTERQALEIAMQTCLTRLLQFTAQMLKFTVTVGLSEVRAGCENIYLSYQEGLRSLDLRGGESGNQVFTKEDLSKSYTRHTAVWQATQYIDANYTNAELSVDHVSTILHISPSYLRSLFKAQTGSTLISYITKVRMEHALVLLKDPAFKNTMIAEKVGYTDAHYFSYCFKRYFGASTSEMREKLVNGSVSV